MIYLDIHEVEVSSCAFTMLKEEKKVNENVHP